MPVTCAAVARTLWPVSRLAWMQKLLVFLPSISRLLCLELNTYTIGKARRCNQGSGQALAGKFCKATLGKAPQYIAGLVPSRTAGQDGMEVHHFTRPIESARRVQD